MQCHVTRCHGRRSQNIMYYLYKTLFRIKLKNSIYVFYVALGLPQVREGLISEELMLFYIKVQNPEKREKFQQSLDSCM